MTFAENDFCAEIVAENADFLLPTTGPSLCLIF